MVMMVMMAMFARIVFFSHDLIHAPPLLYVVLSSQYLRYHRPLPPSSPSSSSSLSSPPAPALAAPTNVGALSEGASADADDVATKLNIVDVKVEGTARHVERLSLRM